KDPLGMNGKTGVVSLLAGRKVSTHFIHSVPAWSAFLHARARQNASLVLDEAKPIHTIGEGKTPHFIAPGERKFDRGLERRVARTVTRGVRVYTCSVVVGPTHPICSMIYGSTGATHFDQLAKILTGYEITGARSSGIFMGILFIAVGSLFKITAVPFRAAVGRTRL
ncbi:nadh-ubiquinone oxidoreductase chain 2, partial [Quercus suber]